MSKYMPQLRWNKWVGDTKAARYSQWLYGVNKILDWK